MLNIGTSKLRNEPIRLTNFKVLLRHLYFRVNMYSQNIFKDNMNDLRYIFEQIERSIKRLINNLKNYKTKPKQHNKNTSIPICIEYGQEFSPFKKVFILVRNFKLVKV